MSPTQPPTRWDSRVICPSVKRPGRGADHSHSSSADVQNEWRYTSTDPHTPSCRAVGQLYFTFPSIIRDTLLTWSCIKSLLLRARISQATYNFVYLSENSRDQSQRRCGCPEDRAAEDFSNGRIRRGFAATNYLLCQHALER